MHRQVVIVRYKQIANFLHVDFHITNPYCILNVTWTLQDAGKHLFDNPRYYPSLVIILNI